MADVKNTRLVLWSMMPYVNTSCLLPTRERREAGATTPHLALVRQVQPDSHTRADREWWSNMAPSNSHIRSTLSP